MPETSSPPQPKAEQLELELFKLQAKKLTEWEWTTLVQNLANELVGVSAEHQRLGELKDTLTNKLQFLRGMVAIQRNRRTIRGDFVRYKLGTIVRTKVYPCEEPKDDNWVLMDQHGRTSTYFWFLISASTRLARRLKTRQDLKFRWHHRKCIKTRDVYTLVEVLKGYKTTFLHAEGRFPARSHNKDVQTTDLTHFYLVRHLHGIPAAELPKIITQWATYTFRKHGPKEEATVHTDSGSVQGAEVRSTRP